VSSADDNSFWGVFWVDVSSTSIATSNFIALARMLGYSADGITDARRVLSNIKKSWLLVLDNADDPEFDYQIYFPSGTHGAIIMTSRVSDCSRYNTIGAVGLTGLDIGDSVQLFLKAAEVPSDSWDSHEPDAIHVVNVLGSHTLALIQAGAYIARGHCTLKEYLEIYQQQRKRLLTFFPKQAQSRYREVYATLEASAEVLRISTSEPAKDALCLLNILSMLHFSSIPVNVFEDTWKGSRRVRDADHEETKDLDALSTWHTSQLPCFISVEANRWDPFRFQEASCLLASLSLVTFSSQPGFRSLSMHPLTHAWAKDRLDLEGQEQAWKIVGSFLALSYHGSSETWQKHGNHLRAHINFYLNSKPGTKSTYEPSPMILQILLKCGWILDGMRHDSRLAQLLDDIFEELQADPKNPSVEKLPLYRLVARNQQNMGQIKEAVALLEQVVKIDEITLVEDHPDRLASQHALAIAYQANGQIKKAVTLLEQVIEIKKITLAKDHPSRLASQHVLATAYRANGQIKETVTLLEQVVEIEKITLTEDHPDRLASQHELAIAYRANGQIKEAVTLQEQVVEIEKITQTEDHPDRLASQHALAIAYRANGQIKEAVALLEQVVEIKKITLAKDHPSRLASQHELAMAYRANGQIKEAMTLLEQVVEIKKITLAKDHPSRLASQHELAMAYRANGQIKEAMTLLEQVVEIKKITLAKDHPDPLASQRALAIIYQANGQIKETVTLLEQVVEIAKITLTEDHPDRLASQHALAIAYRSNEQIEKAVAIEQSLLLHKSGSSDRS
jgi:tetratricopeptide (TPR) repeat protein